MAYLSSLSELRHTRIGKKVLIVGDEPRLVEVMNVNLTIEGYEVETAFSVAGAIEKIRRWEPDVMMLDMVLPGIDGFEALEAIREISNVPVVVVTVLGRSVDIMRGLELGVDDYISRPFSMTQLSERIRSVLMRNGLARVPLKRIEFDNDVIFDFGLGVMTVRGMEVSLRAVEQRLLYQLVKNPGKAQTVDQLMEAMWGRESREAQQPLALYVRHLRNMIEENPDHPRYLLDENGIGYVFRPARDAS
ncbi:MAG: response regulator transcription factor [Dehalococcoidia bacterium]